MKCQNLFWIPLMFAGILLLTASVSDAFANNPLFVVRDVSVDVTAENALAAKEKAFEGAQLKAFEILKNRMLAQDDFIETTAMDANHVSRMVKDFEVNSEKLSSVRYIGNYTFRFDDQAVRRYFSMRGLEFSDIRGKPVLILPFYQKSNQSVLWGAGNPWLSVWQRMASAQEYLPVEVPLGDLQDMRDIKDSQAFSYDETKLASMLGRYGASEAVLVIAVPDPGVEYNSLSTPVEAGMTIYLYRTDRDAPEFVQDIQIQAEGNMTLEELLSKGANEVEVLLQQNWKRRTAISDEGYDKIQARVTFESLKEWLELKNRLSKLVSIDRVNVEKLSRNEAFLVLEYNGSRERVNIALEQAGLKLKRASIRGPEIYGDFSSQKTVYDLVSIDKVRSRLPKPFGPNDSYRDPLESAPGTSLDESPQIPQF